MLFQRDRVGGSPFAAWAASAAFNAELPSQAGTITRLHQVFRLDITTTNATNFQDGYDRLVTRQTLARTGNQAIMDFSNLVLPYHFMRRHAPFVAARRPSRIADSQTNALVQFHYTWHFGTSPTIQNPDGSVEDNPFDLSGGIPPTGKGGLTLSGTWGAAAVMGTNVTINSGQMDLYADTVLPEAGDLDSAFMPRAIPQWTTAAPTYSATGSAFQESYNVPASGYLRSLLYMTRRGTNFPRDSATLNAIQLYNAVSKTPILTYGGQASATADVVAGELLSQGEFGSAMAPSDDNATLGIPSIAQNFNEGLYWFPAWRYGYRPSRSDPRYGFDLTQGYNTGDLALRLGIANVTTTDHSVLLAKYTPL